ncbi:MAG TPA: sulfatase-like hydrolase/transferase [Prolixibacteraceae bacterium]|nr:sulfatase-like hydrolase/transferase [Prolixibacteraceae bacterium]
MNFFPKMVKNLKGNYFLMMVWRLGIVFLLFSVQRIFFYWYNLDQFPGISAAHLFDLMVSGFKFDLTAILYVNLLFILLMVLPVPFKYSRGYKIVTKCVFLVTNSIAFIANLIDFVYFRYTLRRSDFGVFTEFENEEHLMKIIFTAMIQNWYLVLLFLLLFAIVYFTYGDHTRSKMARSAWVFYPVSVVVLAFTLLVTVIGIRGGYKASVRPITISNALEKVSKPVETAIVLNTPFSMIRTVKRTVFKRMDYFPEKELREIYSPIHKGASQGSFKAENVVILILESFTKEVSGILNPDLENGKYKGYTPFLDSLIQHSYTWEFSYANGRKSIDAIPSVIGGIPSLVQPYILSRYSLNEVQGLPALLKKKGYSTSFFHGAPNGSMGFNAIVNNLSVDHYFGMDEYGTKAEYDGFWGIHDEPFLQYCADQFGKLPRPFFASVFTLSSHHPYIVPEKYRDQFLGGPNNEVYKVIQYTDMALQHFFEKASKADWFNNTLFVLVADHSLLPVDHEKYKSSIGSFSVPVIFYQPGNPIVGHDSSLVQQIDIFPSILGLLNYDEPWFSFGSNRFNASEKPFVVNYINGLYQLMEDGYVIQFDGEKVVGFYNYKADITLKHNLMGKNPQAEEALLRRLKAFIQQYNNRMIDNKLGVGE